MRTNSLGQSGPSESKRTSISTFALALAAACVACGGQGGPGDEYRNALPDLQTLRLELPDNGVQSQTGKLVQGLTDTSGQAEHYAFARGTAGELNAFVREVLQTVEAVVQLPPSEVGLSAATWGPHPDEDGVLSWKLTVLRRGTGQYVYSMAARAIDDTEGEFRTIIMGRSTKGRSSVFSGYHGSFGFNATALHELAPEQNPDTGEGVVSYDTRGSRRTIKLGMTGFSEAGGPEASVLYAYRDRADGSGELRFTAHVDINADGSAKELATVRAMWLSSGAGRARLTVIGGDVPAGVVLVVHECWNNDFMRVLYRDSLELAPSEGTADSCAFDAQGPHPEESDADLDSPPADPAAGQDLSS